MDDTLPWHEAQWATACGQLQQQRLPHGLLLHGQAGLGKARFAWRLARRLLCQGTLGATAEACGQCPSCKLAQAGNNPDIYELMVEEDKKSIGIDAVRDLVYWQSVKSHLGGCKVALIREAHKMTVNAANALLKTLEEPAAGTYLLLLTPHVGWLLPTVRSRCQRIFFQPPEREFAQRYLQDKLGQAPQATLALALAGGAPLTAMEYMESGYLTERKDFFHDFLALSQDRDYALEVVERWHKRDPQRLQGWLWGWCRDLIRIKILRDQSLIINDDLAQELSALAQRTSLRALYKFLDGLTDMMTWVDRNLNVQLQFESLLLSWQREVTRSTH